MSPHRLLRWAVVIGAGIAVTLALWQDPVLAYPAGPGATSADLPVPPWAVAVAAGLALAARRRRRPVSVARPRGVPRRLSGSRPPNRRRSRR
ncbi:hypothetical protein V6U81_03895 [Micromonospora sp. CPCC 205711]|uniref:hypothetical protein n=1 Tax=Micromonospora sp. CPCC 205547 TaxID=3122400 RepID=UPI002FEF9193